MGGPAQPPPTARGESFVLRESWTVVLLPTSAAAAPRRPSHAAACPRHHPSQDRGVQGVLLPTAADAGSAPRGPGGSGSPGGTRRWGAACAGVLLVVGGGVHRPGGVPPRPCGGGGGGGGRGAWGAANAQTAPTGGGGHTLTKTRKCAPRSDAPPQRDGPRRRPPGRHVMQVLWGAPCAPPPPLPPKGRMCSRGSQAPRRIDVGPPLPSVSNAQGHSPPPPAALRPPGGPGRGMRKWV